MSNFSQYAALGSCSQRYQRTEAVTAPLSRHAVDRRGDLAPPNASGPPARGLVSALVPSAQLSRFKAAGGQTRSGR